MCPWRLERVFDDMVAWTTAHGGKRPTKAYCSPLVAARIVTRILRETGSVMPPRHQAGLLCNVVGCDWFEDPTLTGTAVRFEA